MSPPPHQTLLHEREPPAPLARRFLNNRRFFGTRNNSTKHHEGVWRLISLGVSICGRLLALLCFYLKSPATGLVVTETGHRSDSMRRQSLLHNRYPSVVFALEVSVSFQFPWRVLSTLPPGLVDYRLPEGLQETSTHFALQNMRNNSLCGSLSRYVAGCTDLATAISTLLRHTRGSTDNPGGTRPY